MSGVLRDFTPGEATLYLEGFVSTGTLVIVEVGAFAFDGEVLFCERRASQYEVHVSIHDFDEAGLRRTPRFPVRLSGRLFIPGQSTPIIANIVDISGDGLGVEVSTVVQPQSLVAVESDSNIALGVVRFSKEITPGNVRLGIQLQHIVQRQSGSASVPAARPGISLFGGKFSLGRRSKNV